VQPAWSITVRTSDNALHIILQSKSGVGPGNLIFSLRICFGNFADMMAHSVHSVHP